MYLYVASMVPLCLPHLVEVRGRGGLDVPDVDFNRPCGVVVFALFYCRLCCGECYVACLQFECFLSMLIVLRALVAARSMCLL